MTQWQNVPTAQLHMVPLCKVRRATAADAAGILACLRAAFAPYEREYTPAAFRDTVLTPETILARLQEMSVFVAVRGQNQIVGTIGCAVAFQSSDDPMNQSLNRGEGHIRGMAVLPALQGKKTHGTSLAAELLRAAEAHLRSLACTRATLDTTAPLQRAIRFYQRNGYRASGRVSDFFGMPLYEYVKELPPQSR